MLLVFFIENSLQKKHRKVIGKRVGLEPSFYEFTTLTRILKWAHEVESLKPVYK